ncbi:MAG: Deoxyribose-phosphate aldolase [Candidatus Aerophobetes bacterium ADurb.Bin490]|jgi:deoxyribose-phosphate aldolase|nr:deoxyribose-phosphate aldolase [Clostridiales bacterium]OPZ65548.1 MAG: Deoxyribose-phosphate aldolase [Candidatus Aerophobetes bacterium ADurb.Bin490]
MNIKDILARLDHTNLKQTVTLDDIKRTCDEGILYNTATICIPPCFVRQASDYVNNKIKVCTVIGFPNGYQTTKVKCFETSQAVKDGADEIDMVINLSYLKTNPETAVREINEIKEAAEGKTLKVIIETCLLTYEEKLTACKILSESKGDFIKTSTGFSTGGATLEDIKLLVRHCKGKRVKAAGGIKSLEDAVQFIEAGADRLGSSGLIRLVKEANYVN